MSAMRRRILTLCLGLSGSLFASGSQAQDASLDRFTEGRTLLDKGDVAGACAKFRESALLRPSVGALARIAECDERDGHLVLARKRWLRALEVGHQTRDDRVRAVEAAIARLDSLIPRLRIALPSPSPEGLRVVLDGDEVAAGAPLYVDPGPHNLAASAPGRQGYVRDFQASAGAGEVAVVVPPLEAEAPRPPEIEWAPAPHAAPQPVAPPPAYGAVPPPAAEVRVSGSPESPPQQTPAQVHAPTVRLVGIAGVALGATLGAVGAYFAASAAAMKAGTHCNGLACPTQGDVDQLQNAKSQADAATGLFVAGGFIAAAGAVCWLASRAMPAAPAGATLRLAPRADGSSFGLDAVGRF
jgi:hypothetical protein